MKKVLGILAVLLLATISMATATPTGNEPIFIDERYDTLNVNVTTAWREGRTIVYAVYITPYNVAGDGKFIGFVKADGAGNLQPSMEEFAYKHRTNLVWHYNNNFQYTGRFTTQNFEYVK